MKLLTSLATFFIALFATAPAFGEDRLALVIGNGVYRNVAALDNPVNDARLMARTLEDVGFRVSNLKLRAIDPAVEEINALAGYGCKVEPVKQARKVVAVRVSWWLKDVEDLKSAFSELQRPRVGRKARISGQDESVIEPTGQLL